MFYTKPYLPTKNQIALLEKRGLIITDRKKAEHYLATIGYYRLSGYSYVFRKSETETTGEVHILDDYKDDVHFHDIIALYVFDKSLRLLMMDAIQRIEIALRVNIALELGKYDVEAHLSPDYLYPTFTAFEGWKKKFQKSFAESREDFVVHFKEKYPQDALPIWMAVELWDFGMLSKYIAQLKDRYKVPIVQNYGISTHKLLVSWLHTLNIVRNISAHHGRLWNRVITAKPQYPKYAEASLLQNMVNDNIPENRIFAVICIIQYLMKYISPNSSWGNRMVELIHNFPSSPHTTVNMMGIRGNWEKWSLWEKNILC